MVPPGAVRESACAIARRRRGHLQPPRRFAQRHTAFSLQNPARPPYQAVRKAALANDGLQSRRFLRRECKGCFGRPVAIVAFQESPKATHGTQPGVLVACRIDGGDCWAMYQFLYVERKADANIGSVKEGALYYVEISGAY